MLRISKIAIIVASVTVFNCMCCISQTAAALKDVNYVDLYNKYITAGRDKSENAAANYKKAFELFVKLPEDFNGFELHLWPQKFPNKKLDSLKEWISANKDSLEQLKIGSQKDAYWIELKNTHVYDYSFPDLAKLRLLNLALCFRSKLNAINGDYDGSFSDLSAVFSIGNQFSGKKFLSEQLIGYAFRVLAVRTTFEILHNSSVLSADLKQLQEKFVALSSETRKLDLYPEKLFTRDYLQDFFTDDGKGDGFISQETIEKESENQRRYFLKKFTEEEKQKYRVLKRNSTLELAEKEYNYLEQIKGETPFQLNQKSRKKVLTEMAKDNIIISRGIEPTFMVIESYFDTKMRTDALITTLALLRYKSDKKDLPESLDTLVSSGYLDKIPMDVCSNGPLIYKKVGGDFLLYSVGGDFDDDKAEVRVKSIWNENGDIVFWPAEKSK